MYASQNFIENNLIILSKQTIDLFLQQQYPSDLISLYSFYYYTAKWQKTNQPKCTTGYVATGLKKSEDWVRKHKKTLIDLKLIEDVRVKNEVGQIEGWYIKINYVWKEETLFNHPQENPPSGKTHRVGKSGVNALNANNINALNANNIKLGDSEESLHHRPKRKTSSEEIKEKHPLIEKWNELPGVRRHGNPNAKNYCRAAAYINQLQAGTFGKLKKFDSSWLEKNKIPQKIIDKKWTEDEIWTVMQNMATMYVEGYWPQDKTKAVKELDILFFNKVRGTSRFLQCFISPNKLLKSEIKIKIKNENVYNKFKRLVEQAKIEFDESSLTRNINSLVDEVDEIININYKIQNNQFGVYVGKPGSYKLLDAFHAHLDKKILSGGSLFVGMLKPGSLTWRNFVKEFEKYHGDNFKIYPTFEQIKNFKNKLESEKLKAERERKSQKEHDAKMSYEESI